MDVPKSLHDIDARKARGALLEAPHIAPLTRFVHQLRARMGSEYAIPYFDPLDGGIGAECLFLLEAPGPKAVDSGFVSRNNPDETAKNFFLLNEEAMIPRSHTITWNIVPWYVGSGGRIRAVGSRDIHAAKPALAEFLELLPRLRYVVLVGAKASRAHEAIASSRPNAQIFCMPHPSPMYINRAPTNRKTALAVLKKVAGAMGLSPNGG
jgi:hypothetical protein